MFTVNAKYEEVHKSIAIVRKDPRLNIRMIDNMLNTNERTIMQVLLDELIMTKVCAKMVPVSFTQE